MSQADLGGLLFAHKDLIRKVEAAERNPSEALVKHCDEVLGAAGRLRWMWPLLERERLLRQARDPAGQTRAFVFHPGATDRPVLDWLLAPPRDTRQPDWNTEFDSPARERLQQLRRVGQVHGAGDAYPEVVAWLGHDLDALISHSPRTAIGFLELAGYEAVDLGADGVAQSHYLRALEIVTEGGDRLYGGYLIAVSLAHLALHRGDADQAARLATAALHGTDQQSSYAVRAAFRAVLARAHARRGDKAACAAALLQVEADLSRRDFADEPSWISYFGEADLADEKAHCLFDLGLHKLAQREGARAIELMDPRRVRRLALDTALHAASLARSRAVEHACEVGYRAVDHAAQVASFRSAHRIALMLAELQPYADLPMVRHLHEYVHSRLPAVVTLRQAARSP
ncbi:hypothetical protein BDK92_6722 [Micromonospora pisi]|uniref:Transcriptional regulator n=2 Tax=Micromonospora pisi TaxID=589240 RepID=A0A495JVD7_9ACTN|nr:hypothetical protein BDK92_6722 [Micromonospora pisi]